MKFVLSSLTDIKLDIFDRRSSGVCIEAVCEGNWLWEFEFALEEAIEGSDTMKKYREYSRMRVKEMYRTLNNACLIYLIQ
jgi:hypothetical protein